MSRRNAKERRAKRQENRLGSEIMGAATDLREALRPVVAFRGELEKCETEEQLRLALLEGDFPTQVTRALDVHQNLLLALAIGARVEAEDKGEVNLERKIDNALVDQKVEEAPVAQPRRPSLAATLRKHG